MKRRLAAIVAVIVLGTIVASLFTERGEKQSVIQEAYSELQLLAVLRAGSLELHFATTFGEIEFWTQRVLIQDAIRDLQSAWKNFGTGATAGLQKAYIDDNPHPLPDRDELDRGVGASDYHEIHARIQPFLRDFIRERGYYDLFLINPDGDVIYSIEKESDYATNLTEGEWRESGLASVFNRAWREEHDGIAFVDFAAYGPSNGAPASFAAGVIIAPDGERLGVFALQTPSEPINEIMRATSGMGESGETYIVANDLLMHSDSRFSETSTILETVVDTPSVRLALDGETGVHEIVDYRGVPVLSAFVPLQVNGTQWALLAEIDRAEVVARLDKRRSWLRGMALVAGIGCALAVLWSIYLLLAPDDPV